MCSLANDSHRKCPKCQLLVDNRVEHLIWHCAKNLTIRKSVWDLVIDIGGINLFTKLMHKSQLEQCGFLLCMAVDNCDDYLLHMNFALTLCKCLPVGNLNCYVLICVMLSITVY